MRRAHFRELRRAIYRLKRRFPTQLGIYRDTGSTLDVETGARTNSIVSHQVARAILLPQRISRDFSYDLAYIAANKEFTHGAFYDIESRRILVSRRDIPANWPLDLNNWLVVKHQKYEISKIDEFEDEEVVMFIAKALTGTPAREHHNVLTYSSIGLTQTVGVTVS